MSAGRLIVCPTPIGNLEDVTLRVLAALREADIVACEDTRRTRTLLQRYGVTGTLISYHEHNERERAAELIPRMRSGAVVALVSDAGMPLVSDPGFILVEACVAADVRDTYLKAINASLDACLPLKFTGGLGGSLAGRPIAIRYVDNRQLEKKTETK